MWYSKTVVSVMMSTSAFLSFYDFECKGHFCERVVIRTGSPSSTAHYCVCVVVRRCVFAGVDLAPCHHHICRIDTSECGNPQVGVLRQLCEVLFFFKILLCMGPVYFLLWVGEHLQIKWVNGCNSSLFELTANNLNLRPLSD